MEKIPFQVFCSFQNYRFSYIVLFENKLSGVEVNPDEEREATDVVQATLFCLKQIFNFFCGFSSFLFFMEIGNFSLLFQFIPYSPEATRNGSSIVHPFCRSAGGTEFHSQMSRNLTKIL